MFLSLSWETKKQDVFRASYCMEKQLLERELTFSENREFTFTAFSM